MAVFLLCLVLISCTIALLYFFNSAGKSSNTTRRPPGPRPLPVIGNLLLLGDKPHRSMARLAKLHGPVMSLELGQVTTIVVSSAKAAREVLMEKDHAFCGRSPPDSARPLDHLEGSLVWMPAAGKWKALRQVCSAQLFTPQKLDSNRELRLKKVRELVAYFRERSGRAVEVGRPAFVTALNMVTNTLFSIDMVDLLSDSKQDFRDVVKGIIDELGTPNVSDFFPFLARFDLQGKRRRAGEYSGSIYQTFDGLIEQRLQQAKDSAPTKTDFLDALLNSTDIDRHSMKSLFAELFVASTDVVSDTVEWAMAELLRSPDRMAKARAEVAEAIPRGKDVEESDVMDLPYLHAVIKETFRLHPPAPFLIPRQTETDTDLLGYDIPAGTRVLVNAWAIGRDGGVWREPDEFRPERFGEREVEYKGRDMELIPFGAGRRICPGLPLGSRMVHVILAALLREFEWRLPEGMRPEDVDLADKIGITLSMVNPLVAVPIAVE